MFLPGFHYESFRSWWSSLGRQMALRAPSWTVVDSVNSRRRSHIPQTWHSTLEWPSADWERGLCKNLDIPHSCKRKWQKAVGHSTSDVLLLRQVKSANFILYFLLRLLLMRFFGLPPFTKKKLVCNRDYMNGIKWTGRRGVEDRGWKAERDTATIRFKIVGIGVRTITKTISSPRWILL